MSTCGLPDIYTLSPRALGVYIRQITCAHGITIKCTRVVNRNWITTQLTGNLQNSIKPILNLGNWLTVL